jgi:hypothetical protein
VRHEDVVFVTEDGAQNMTKWSGTPEEQAVVNSATTTELRRRSSGADACILSTTAG